ncbi:MAG: O-antigen ligase family protein [Hyphomicrobiaceae bacterium]|nr:O-antigen ligase family protein [Hyphomicrobiaceae bacterium]
MSGDTLTRLQGPRMQIAVATTAILALAYASTFLGPAVIVVAALPLAFWLAVSFPTIWVLVFLALSQYRIPDAIGPLHSLHLPLAFGAMALAATVWHVVLARTYPASWRRELVLMLALLALAAVGLVVALDRPRSQQFLLESYWKIIAVAFALAWIIRREVDFRHVTITTLLSGIVIGLVANYNKYHGIDLVEGTRVAIGIAYYSPLADPNDLALILMCPFCFSLAMLVYRPSPLLTALGAVAAAATLTGIMATQSRGGLLAVVAGLGVVGIHYVRSRNTLLLLLAATAALLFLAMGIGGRQSGGFAELQESGLDQSSYLRTLAWTAAINMGLDRPYTGVGIAGFPSAFYFYTPEWVQRDLAPHSTWFGILGEMGFVGLLVLVTMIARAMVTVQTAKTTLDTLGGSVQMRAFALGLKGSLVTFCVGGTFLGQHVTWPLYTIVALVVALGIFAETHAREVLGSSPPGWWRPDRTRRGGRRPAADRTTADPAAASALRSIPDILSRTSLTRHA